MKALKKVGTWVAAKYNKVETRYGKTGAKVIFGLMIVTFPIPGNVTVVLFGAELIKKIKG